LFNCHNCKNFINTTNKEDVFVFGQCVLKQEFIIDADNEKCNDYEKSA
jgi:hypothetical protein